MGRGGYNGGGTIIGWGARWSDWHHFPAPASRSDKSLPVESLSSSERKQRRAQARAAAKAAKGGKQKRPRRTRSSTLTQKDVLEALGLLKAAGRLNNRGDILKRLVAEGFLLPTGLPNPDHPEIRAIEKRTETQK